MSADLWAAFGDSADSSDKNLNPWPDAPSAPPPASNSYQNAFQSAGNGSNPGRASGHLPFPPDPWADFGNSQAESGSGMQSQIQPTNASTADIDDEWSAFESAERDQTNQEDDWGAFNNPASTTQESNTVQPRKKPLTDTFDNDGLMWDADEELQAGPQTSRPFAVPPVHNKSDSLIDIFDAAEEADPDYRFHAPEPQAQYQGAGDNDDFGDFEEAEPVPAPTQSAGPMKTSSHSVSAAGTIMQNRIETQGASAANRLIFGATQKGSIASAKSTNQTPTRAQASQSPMLVAKAGNKPPTVSSNANLGLSKGLPARPVPPTKSATPPSKQSNLALSVNQDIDDDEGDAWDDFETTAPSQLLPEISSAESRPRPDDDDTSLPPSNVPPPSILLSHLSNAVLPELIKSAPTSTSTVASPNVTLRTAARILTGRKLRWKRDTHLAQSMSISAAGSGGAGGSGRAVGMKLAGIDRAESGREDREAAELVRTFKAGAGALRARALKAVATDETVSQKGAGIVELRETMPVRVEQATRTAKPGKAGAGAGARAAGSSAGTMKPCVICGLRRAERVAGVDGEVFDGFGEWWVEHWGHRECKDWWRENERRLCQR